MKLFCESVKGLLCEFVKGLFCESVKGLFCGSLYPRACNDSVVETYLIMLMVVQCVFDKFNWI